MQNRLVFRADSASNWLAANPVLAVGEPAYDFTTHTLKIGDGTTPFSDLPGLDIDSLTDYATIDDSQSQDGTTGRSDATLSSAAIHTMLNALEVRVNAYADLVTQQVGGAKWVPLIQNSDGTWPASTATDQDSTLGVGIVGLGAAPLLPKATDIFILKDSP